MNGDDLILVTEIEPMCGHPTIQAHCTVQLGALEICGVRIVKVEDKPAFVALPKVQDKEGQWHPVVQCRDRTLNASITSKVLEAWHKNQEEPMARRTVGLLQGSGSARTKATVGGTVSYLNQKRKQQHRRGVSKPQNADQKGKRPLFGDIL